MNDKTKRRGFDLAGIRKKGRMQVTNFQKCHSCLLSTG